MLKTPQAFEILARLSEKGILGKAMLKEINKDIESFLEEERFKEKPL
ncbi:hypothetical protein [Antarcticibacterium arcticum]|nr:hypothetical protein [Antarcticibacterium arcticum]